MNLIILDQNFDTLGVVSVFNTLIWDRRYYASGLFELHTPAEFFTLMNTGRYLYRNDRDELGVIREVNFARDAKGTRTAYCKGYFSEELLNGRVLNTQISLTGTPGGHRPEDGGPLRDQPDRCRPEDLPGQTGRAEGHRRRVSRLRLPATTWATSSMKSRRPRSSATGYATTT